MPPIIRKPTGPACATSINYSPSGGSIARNGTRQLTVTTSTGGCMPYWYVDRPDIAQITGADTLIVVEGKTYYAGMNAILRGVFQGSVNVCVQIHLTNPAVKECKPWTVTSASTTSSVDGEGRPEPRLRHIRRGGGTSVIIRLMKKGEKTGGVLYRKYRPQSFSDVIGQEHIVKVLEGAVTLGNISHAYLFSGTRGTGKTSIARILARAIGTSANDLVEMDAASQTGVDDIRALNESVYTLPYESKFKVYIIDEAHMLSKPAWNAFLKTLEEPPSYVVFILATTEIEKVPETVISRCQTFTFKSPNLSVLKDFALSIAKKEGAKLEPAAAELVALLGDGSFRDAHSILEKVLSSTKDKIITREEVETVTGAPKSELVKNILEAVVEKNLEKGLKAVGAAGEANNDMKLFAKLILERMRFLFLLRLKAGMNDYIAKQVSEDDFNYLKDLAAKAGADLTSDTLLRFIEAYESSGRTSIPELALELALADSIKN